MARYEASARIDLINTNQFEVLLNYARSKPLFSALLQTLPHRLHRSSIFDDAAFAIARVQQAVGKSFVLTQHRQPVNHSDWHPDLLIKQGSCCQLSLTDGTKGFDPTSFRIVTNASRTILKTQPAAGTTFTQRRKKQQNGTLKFPRIWH